MIHTADMDRVVKQMDNMHDNASNFGIFVRKFLSKVAKRSFLFLALVVFGTALSVYGFIKGVSVAKGVVKS